MQFYVKTLHETIKFVAEPTDLVAKIKTQIQDKTNIPSNQQWLIYGTKPLDDSKSLSCYNIQKDSTLDLCLRLHGGYF